MTATDLASAILRAAQDAGDPSTVRVEIEDGYRFFEVRIDPPHVRYSPEGHAVLTLRKGRQTGKD